jgi:hypothetical protein
MRNPTGDTWFSHRPYCTSSGLSSPYRWFRYRRSASRSCGRIDPSTFSSVADTPPGARAITRNTSRVIPSSVGTISSNLRTM